VIQLILGIVAIAVGLPLLVTATWALFFRENDNMKIETELTPQFMRKLISPMYGFGIFIENIADAQDKGEIRPYIVMSVIGLALSIAGYWLIKM
jgi:hypothetical protein